MKYLIINADDFGYSEVFNEKILELIEEGFVSSTSVMVDWMDENQKKQIEKLIELSPETVDGHYLKACALALGEPTDDEILDSKNWKGTNWLGEEIMKVREKIKRETIKEKKWKKEKA